MDISLNLPLETLAQIKIVQFLLKKSLYNATFDHPKMLICGCPVLKEQLTEMVMYLNLPEFLKQKLVKIIPPIHEELRQYLITMENYVIKPRFLMIALASVCFTSTGTVDYKRSAQLMLQDKNLKSHERYIIACNYCLEEEISRLCITCLAIRYQVRFHANEVLQAWNHVLTHPTSWDNVVICEEAFYASVKEYNVVAAEYFFERLPDRHKHHCIRIGVSKLKFPNAANYSINYRNMKLLLFSKFKKHFWERNKHKYCKKILTSLSFWPYQDIFMKHAISICEYIPDSMYKILIKKFAQNIETDLADYDYVYLLKELLNLYSEDYKQGLLKLFSNNLNVCKHIIFLLNSK